VLVVTGNVITAVLAGIVMLDCTCADATVQPRLTVTGTGTAADRFIVPVRPCPLTTDDVLTVTDSSSLSTVTPAVALDELYEAVKVTPVLVPTAEVLIVNVAEVWPP
jgi:hypothetical protein